MRAAARSADGTADAWTSGACSATASAVAMENKAIGPYRRISDGVTVSTRTLLPPSREDIPSSRLRHARVTAPLLPVPRRLVVVVRGERPGELVAHQVLAD